ncbi:MAG: PilZ domain-containing protein [Myxococcaceae bacterium]|nr:PilZ domain-containing protein [Myxococcaceae bacterium]
MTPGTRQEHFHPPLRPEKRSHPRLAVALTAHCRIGNRFIRDAVADLSEGGLYLRTKEPAREGTPVRVALALPHDDGPKFCTLVGNVARIDRDPRGRLLGLGVSFDDSQTALHDRSTLHAFIARA